MPPAENIEINGWIEYRKLVLTELERLNAEIITLKDKIDTNKDRASDDNQTILKEINTKVDSLTHHQMSTDTKVSNIYASAAAISAIVGIVIGLLGVVSSFMVIWWNN